MKNMTKKIITLLLALLLTFTLASCNNDDSVSVIPYGDLSTEAYISAGDYSVSYQTLYNKMHSQAYQYVEENIIRQIDADLITESIANYKDEAKNYVEDIDFNYKEEFDSVVFSAIYSTTSVETVASLSTFDNNTYLEKYAATMLNTYGVTVDVSDLDFDLTADIPTITTLPDTLLNYYGYYIAEKVKAFTELSADMDIEKVDGVSSSDYLAENNYKVAYATYSQSFFNSTGVVVKFNSLADANATIKAVTESEVGPLTDANAEEFYIALYNTYYSYRTPITSADFTVINDEDATYNENTHFAYDISHDDLTTIGTNLRTLYVDGLADGEYTTTPRNTDGTYLMAYRGATIYQYGGKSTETAWDDLTDAEILSTKKDIKSIVLKGRVSDDYITTNEEDVLDELDIDFYDSIIRSLYISANDSHYEDGYDNELATDSDSLIYKFTYNDKEYTYSVSDLFDKLESIYGIDYSMTLLTNEYLLANYSDTWLTDDDKSDLDDQFDAVMTSFNNGELDGYSTDLGEDNFKALYFGYTDDNEIKEEYYYANSLRSIYTTKTYYYSDYYNLADSDNKFDSANTLFTNLKTFNDLNSDNQFSLDVTHMLISVDDAVDGTLDNPADFRESLTDDAAREAYDTAVMDLVNAIVAETNSIDATNTEAFTYIVKAFNNNLDLTTTDPDYVGKNWSEFKSIYHFSLKTETLGTIDSSSVSNYVFPFGSHAKSLYNSIKDTFDSENEYLEFTDSKLTDIDDLCTTTYGYHIFDVTDLDTTSNSALFTADDDRYIDTDDESLGMVYENLPVTVDTVSEDVSDITANGYSDTDQASTNQLFVYFFESQTTDGVISLKSSVETSIDDTFSTVSSRFLSSSFQSYKLMYDLQGDSSSLSDAITFATDDAANDVSLNVYLQSIEDTIDGYTNPDETVGYIFGSWFDMNWNN